MKGLVHKAVTWGKGKREMHVKKHDPAKRQGHAMNGFYVMKN
jgi:hypothetical protein